MKSPGAVCSSARPSRKSKEKFQRNLERKRQMGKNIEDYVSDDSEDNEQRKLPKLLGAKQSRRQRGLLGQVHLVTTSSTIPQSRRSGTGLAQQRTRLPNAVPAGLQKDLVCILLFVSLPRFTSMELVGERWVDLLRAANRMGQRFPKMIRKCIKEVCGYNVALAS